MLIVADSDFEPNNNSADPAEAVVRKKKKRKRNSSNSDRVRDDGLLDCYKFRLERYYKRLEEEQRAASIDDADEDVAPEYYQLKGGLKVPNKIWNSLY